MSANNFCLKEVCVLVALPIFFFSFNSNASESCSGGEFSHAQCEFVVPSVVSGDVSIVDSVANPSFEGKLVASCKNGSLVVGKKTCEPIDKTTCAVPSSTWVSPEGDFCSHPAQNTPLKDGALSDINSINGVGSVTYSCSMGNLNIKNMKCGGEKESSIVGQTSYISPNFSAQSASTATAQLTMEFHSDYDIDGSASDKAKVRAGALQSCNTATGFDSSSMGTAQKTSYSSVAKKYYYQIQCPLVVAARCDQGIVIDNHMIGGYNRKNGEFTKFPSGGKKLGVCTKAGYSSMDKELYLGRTGFTIDDFRGAFLCGGKQSSCSAEPALGSPVLMSAESCTVGTVRSGLLRVARGTQPTTAFMQEQACAPLGFDGLKSVSSLRKEDATGSFDFYSATLECTGYQNGQSDPLLPSCSSDGSVGGNSSVSPISCDVAEVSRTIRGNLDPELGIYTIKPNNANVLANVCNASDYGTLDKIITSQPVTPEGYFLTTAQCSAFTGTGLESCLTKDPCLGEPVSANADVPKIELNGVYYRDECSAVTPPPDNLCESCNAKTFTFNGSGSTSGNSCTIDVSPALSGEVDSYSFANTSINGSVDVLCNNGSLRVSDNAICYKSCPGNVTVGWDDARGDKSCGQTIPAGVYKHNQTVSLSTSISNTGSASFKCDGVTGKWEQQSGSCKINCSGGINWGTGRDGNNKSKVNLCSATLPATKHLGTGSLSSATAMTTGSTSYKCDDGTITQNSSSCQSTCAATTLSWGGQCSSSISNVVDGNSKNLTHSKSSSYAFASSISGSAKAMCVDGKFKLSSTSCKFISNVDNGTWGAWSETGRSCTYSPEASKVLSGTRFNQTKRCDVNFKRTKAVYNVWNDGSRTYVRTDTDTKSEVEVTESSVVGTRVPKSCGAQTISFGGACKTRTTTVSSGTGKIFNHNQGSPYLFTSGSISASCSDGTLSTSVISCRYVQSSNPGTWGNWASTGSTCTVSPEASAYYKGTWFDQTETCLNTYKRTRRLEYKWNDGSTSYGSTETGHKSDSTSTTRSVIGTKVAPSSGSGGSRDICAEEGLPGWTYSSGGGGGCCKYFQGSGRRCRYIR